MKLSASDRKALVKLAGTLPKGSKERRAILAGLKKTAKIDWSIIKDSRGHLLDYHDGIDRGQVGEWDEILKSLGYKVVERNFTRGDPLSWYFISKGGETYALFWGGDNGSWFVVEGKGGMNARALEKFLEKFETDWEDAVEAGGYPPNISDYIEKDPKAVLKYVNTDR